MARNVFTRATVSCRKTRASLKRSSTERLPATLSEALVALHGDACLKEGLGAQFVDYYCRVKEAEIARFNLEVSDWEHREYFDLF